MSRLPSPAAVELSDRIATRLADRWDALYGRPVARVRPLPSDRPFGPVARSRGPRAAHGTLKRYRKWGCRCVDCRAVSAEHRKRMRAAAKERAS